MLLSLVAAALMSGDLIPAPAPTSPSSAATIAAPQWLRKPTAADFARYYPEAAQSAGLDGRAIMQCTVARSGVLVDCEILEETPAGHGFGSSLLRLAPMFRMSPHTSDGKSVEGGTVRIPMKFRLPR